MTETEISSFRKNFKVAANLSEVCIKPGIIIFISRSDREFASFTLPCKPREKSKPLAWTKFQSANSSPYQAQKAEESFNVALSLEISTRARIVAFHEKKKADAAVFDAALFYSPGDVIVNTWGHDQTNRDFYRVEKVTRHTLKLSLLKSQFTTIPKSMSGTIVPLVDELETDMYLCRQNGSHKVTQYGVRFKYGHGKKWCGNPLTFTYYA